MKQDCLNFNKSEDNARRPEDAQLPLNASVGHNIVPVIQVHVASCLKIIHVTE